MDLLDKLTYHYIFYILFFVFGLFVSYKISIFIAGHRIAKSRRQGEKGEVIAKKWLEGNQFAIISEQVQTKSYWYVNGKKNHFDVRPDFIVEKNGDKCIIEVKTGESASLKNGKTRRQIREYSCLYPDYDIALFDATNLQLYYLDFDNDVEVVYEERPVVWFFAAGVLFGFTIFYILQHFF